ncbi:MAG: Hsp70 family protein [Desulfomonile sp.]
MSREYAVGIDLGTTNSLASVYRKKVAETLKVDGRNTVPSVVSFRNGQILVGAQAKARLLADPENSVGSVKRFMGDAKKKFVISGKTYTPVDISSLILKKIVEGASASMGEPIKKAVITVPAYFNEAQKLDTRRAGEKIGLEVLRLMPEPTAAAVFYGLDQEKNQQILVYDLGGGTFDVSILRIEGNDFRVVAVDGDSHLGGDDFDQIIVKHLADLFKKQTGIDLYHHGKGPSISKNKVEKQAAMALQRLKESAEACKMELSEMKSTEIMIPDILGHAFEAEITQDEFIRMTQHLLVQTVEKMRAVLKAARLTAADIDRVILVGGSTRHPKVKELVTAEIKEPYTAERVDEIVSHGAAIMAANIFLPVPSPDTPVELRDTPVQITVRDVMAHSLGIALLNQTLNRQEFEIIIPKNTTYPCKNASLCWTIQEYQQSVLMKVFRGEDRIPDNNEYLGQLILPIKTPREWYVPVVAVFELDSDGLLHFTGAEIDLDESTQSALFQAVNENSLPELLEKLIQSGFARTMKTQIKVPQ